MFEVHYTNQGKQHVCECDSYVQAFNCISFLRNRIACRLLDPTTIELYSPSGHLSYQLTH